MFWVNPVSGFKTVILAPGTIAPELSETVPLMVPRSCPKAMAAATKRHSTTLRNSEHMSPSPEPKLAWYIIIETGDGGTAHVNYAAFDDPVSLNIAMWTRRHFAALLAMGTSPARGQGVSTRNVAPTPRGKPSGLPFHARFTDVAADAGLRSPVICGGTATKSYILETVGCGCAFLDYDNDGWLDIFVLSGTTIEGTPDATNRLYKNNRDGTFTDVTDKAGLRRTGWASAVTVGDYDNDGFDDLFVTYWGQNVLYRNNGDGTFSDVTERAGLLR